MTSQISAWDRSRYKLRQRKDWQGFFVLVGLFLAALLAFSLNLGDLPLLEPETSLAQIAQQIQQAPLNDWQGLLAKLLPESDGYQPPLVPFLIALLSKVSGMNPLNAWTIRLPGAFLAACSVPLFYSLGRELFGLSTPALFSALIYLTLLPVLRQGRMAIPDGVASCLAILIIWAVLRSRRDLRWPLGVGISFSLISLTEPILGFLVAAIALGFLAWDTPRLLTSAYFWGGILLGILPMVVWQGLVLLQGSYSWTDLVFWKEIGNQGLSWQDWAGMLLFSSPWLFFALLGVGLARQERNWGWAKLILVWIPVYLGWIFLIPGKPLAIVLNIAPALALAGGVTLAGAVNFPWERPYPRLWLAGLTGLAAIAGGIGLGIYLQFALIFLVSPPLGIIASFASLALTLAAAALLIAQRDRQFIPVLFWGMYVSLLLLVSASHWI
jgi:4-amino-4-deoxy-L-arabinose transferase-like glycosyltransferase